MLMHVIITKCIGTYKTFYDYMTLASYLVYTTHMQFLAARSLCSKLLLARYSMPLATCYVMSINFREADV